MEETLGSQCININRNLTYKMLPVQLVVKNFIKDEQDCNYEIYLMELINASDYFQKLSCGEKYKRPIDEAHGQSDANSECYCIDFKLLIAETMMEGKSILSSSITKYCDGAYGFGGSKARDKKEKMCTNICQALRYLSLEELGKIEEKTKRTTIEKDILCFLQKIKTCKNILYFYPYEFGMQEESLDSVAINEVMKALYNDLKVSLTYRQKYADGFDTYVTTIYKDKFVIFKMSSSNCEIVDIVDTNKIKIFENLRLISDF